MRELTSAGISGFLATIPMSVSMELMHRSLPVSQKAPLPPKQITDRAAEAVDMEEAVSSTSQWDPMTLMSHFSYGTTVGSFYQPVQSTLPGSPAVRGALFGLGVWAGSYLGLLPLLGMHPPATRETAERNSMMIAAHLVWGASLGVLNDYFSKRAVPQTQA